MEWKVPFSDLKFDQEEKNAVQEVLDSGWVTMGPRVAEFENEFSNNLGCSYAVAVSNCTAALHLSLLSAGIKAGDEVILPALNFIASYNAIKYVGAIPVLVDPTNLDDFTMSLEMTKSKITPKTKAILPMHYGGYPSDMEKLIQLSGDHHLVLLEDAAHAPGASLNNKSMGTWGQSGSFSFFGNKNLVTGEGGMVVTNDEKTAEKIKLMRSHGMTAGSLDKIKGHAFSYDIVVRGYNYRMTEMNAALGLVQLKKLKKNNKIRKNLVQYYIEKLGKINEIHIPFKSYRGEPSFHIFVILVKDMETRGKAMEFLKSKGIGTSIHYPPLHQFSLVQKEMELPPNSLPLTEEISSRLISLPLHPWLTENDIHYIAESFKEFFSK